ncbi:hypothetical protein GCM10009819_20250 [Agromyces tropicus]|uniref:Uncharacterized protein n=1 Tax=Agromyces tropicus TaxID=555371 RepID=A0ABN2UE68_9MICO
MWWAGHVQLPIAVALAIAWTPVFLIGATSPPGGISAGPGILGVQSPGFWPSLLGLGMAGPFALSGLMLRAHADAPAYRAEPIGDGLLRRLLLLTAAVVGIAVISIALTVVAVLLLLQVGSWVRGTS